MNRKTRTKPLVRQTQLAAVWRERLAHLRYFEYWPTRLLYLPIYAKVLSWALRLRSLSFMTVVNPCMEYGGLLNYSKSKILAALPPDKLLRSCLVSSLDELNTIAISLAENGLSYPIIAKPDLGERGFAVQVIDSEQQLKSYLESFQSLSKEIRHPEGGGTVCQAKPNSPANSGKLPDDYKIILQEYFHPAQEFAVLYSISPDEAQRGELGQIRSICAKQPLVLTGDGWSHLWQLVANHERAAKRFRLLQTMWQQRWYDVLPHGASLQVTQIGAHCLGTDFYSAQDRNCPELLEVFAQLTQTLNPESSNGQLEFCFGRYDILAQDWQAVLRGEFKVIELNGVNAEPIHIYQPKYSLWLAWKTLWQHWQRIGLLAQAMIRRGHRPCTSSDLLAAIREHDKKIRQYS